jgi:hypothetical protein
MSERHPSVCRSDDGCTNRERPDTPLRIRLSGYASPDTPLRIRLSGYAFPDTPLRVRLSGYASPDTPLRIRLSGYASPDTPLRIRRLRFSACIRNTATKIRRIRLSRATDAPRMHRSDGCTYIAIYIWLYMCTEDAPERRMHRGCSGETDAPALPISLSAASWSPYPGSAPRGVCGVSGVRRVRLSV